VGVHFSGYGGNSVLVCFWGGAGCSLMPKIRNPLHGFEFCSPLCYSSTISIIIGKLKNDYGSLMVALFFVAVLFSGFLFTQKTGVIKESGASGASSVAVRAADIASVANDNASLNAPSSAVLSTTTETEANSFILSAPEFLSLGEVKDPGTFMKVALNQSGTIAYETAGAGNQSGVASSLALKLGRQLFSL
jgi:hypothetical protein